VTDKAGKKNRRRSWFDWTDGVGCLGDRAGCLLSCLVAARFGFAWMS
jgi:hypothetical protein